MLHVLLDSRFPIAFADVEASLECDGTWVGDLKHRTRDGRELTVTAHKRLHVNSSTQQKVILEMLTDVTAQRRAEVALRDSQVLLRTVIETAPGPTYAKDLQGRMMLANHHTLTILDKSWSAVDGRTDREFLDDTAQAEAVMANDRRIMESGQPATVEEAIGHEYGHGRIWLSTKTPMRDLDDWVTGLVGVSVEITELKRVEDRLRLMVNELNHRVKNTLATVQAIASQTLRRTDPEVRLTLEARLRALAAAHDVLTQENWEGASLHDVIDGVLAPHGGAAQAQFEITGPPLRLQPRAAVALSMGLHELTTNALKYGALSSAAGMVAIRWMIRPGDQPQLRIDWIERGGPPVTAPATRGFGTRLLERGLAQDLAGAVQLAFAPEGFVCSIDAPLAEVTVSARIMRLPRVDTMRGN
ncbi:MAG: sensor histidine kinase [Rhodopila sp.]